MKRSTIILWAVIAVLAFSCRNSQKGSEKKPGTSDAVETTAEVSGPQILLIYPGQKKADSLKKAIGTEAFYRLSDENGSHFNALRAFLSGTGITVTATEISRFRFISDEGTITITDLSRLGSPWQVLMFTGNGTPVLSPPSEAIQRAGALFGISEKSKPRIFPKHSKKQVSPESAGHNIHERTQDSLPLPPAPLFREMTLRLMLPSGIQPPLNRNETSGLRIVTSYISPLHRFSLIFDNDIFSNTDRYYTNGVMLEYTAPDMATLPVSRLMIPAGNNSLVHASLSLHHAMYTPFTTKNPPSLDSDRPYASTLFVRYTQTSGNDKSGTLIISSIDAGVIGDAALGRYFQKSVHASVPTNDEPLGWETQIRNDLILNYSAEFRKQLAQKRFAEVFASGAINAGTLHTNVSMGIDATAGVFAPEVTTLPDRNEEPGRQSDKWQYGVSGGIECRLIGYDASLQGGLFNKSNIYTLKPEELERMVATIHLGIFARYRKLGISISQHYLSQEFKAGQQHFWGRIGLEYGW